MTERFKKIRSSGEKVKRIIEKVPKMPVTVFIGATGGYVTYEGINKILTGETRTQRSEGILISGGGLILERKPVRDIKIFLTKRKEK